MHRKGRENPDGKETGECTEKQILNWMMRKKCSRSGMRLFPGKFYTWKELDERTDGKMQKGRNVEYRNVYGFNRRLGRGSTIVRNQATEGIKATREFSGWKEVFWT